MQLYSTSSVPLVGIPFLLSTYEYKETGGSMMVELVHDKDGWPTNKGLWRNYYTALCLLNNLDLHDTQQALQAFANACSAVAE
jgi:hypothetical protein